MWLPTARSAAFRFPNRVSEPEPRTRPLASQPPVVPRAPLARQPDQDGHGNGDRWEDTDEAKKTPIYWPPGIEVDPNGLLRGLTHEEKGQTLSGLGHRAREADINTDMRAKSSLRLVSLTRLEKELAKKLAAGHSVPETMQHLAGLTQIKYVFVYPDQNEVVIGGPAEGWKYDASGRAVARESARPSLFLDDLVTVLRTFSPRGSGYFNCQILPREEGLRRIQQFVQESNARGPLDAGQVSNWTKQLQRELGLQDVEINGVPVESRIAQVIFEADYRLKMIGIGKLHAGHGIPSYFDIIPKTGEVKSAKMDALRWWLSMKYDAVTHSPDRNVFQIEGSAVLCQSENEHISAKGQRIHTGTSEVANGRFATEFTDHYGELAADDPVFADLQNIFDLSLVAALISDNRVPDRIGWNLGVFAANGGYQPATFQPPRTIQSVVNHRVYNGKDIVVQVAGGVDGRMRTVLEDHKVFRESPTLTAENPRASPLSCRKAAGGGTPRATRRQDGKRHTKLDEPASDCWPVFFLPPGETLLTCGWRVSTFGRVFRKITEGQSAARMTA